MRYYREVCRAPFDGQFAQRMKQLKNHESTHQFQLRCYLVPRDDFREHLLEDIMKDMPDPFAHQKKASRGYKPKGSSSRKQKDKVGSSSTSGQVSTNVRGMPPLSRTMQHKIMMIVGMMESKGDVGKITPVSVHNKRKGIAYGMLQLLSRHGGVDRLLSRYRAAGGKYAEALLRFGSARDPKVSMNPSFQSLLKAAGRDPVMKQVQMALFADEYLTPALSFGNKLGLSLSASFLVVFDTFIHFGPQKWARKKIRGFVRKYGETRGLSLYLDWMKGYLTRRYAKEGRTPSQRANVVRYNRWRASVLQKLLVSNPSLNGVISLKAPQWRREVKVK